MDTEKLPIYPLEIVRGSSNTFNVTMQDPERKTYILQKGEVMRFGVKVSPRSKEYLIYKTLTSADYKNGVYPVVIKPSDTKNLPFDTYFYDVGVQPVGEDDYYPVVGVSPFVIAENVTEAVANG